MQPGPASWSDGRPVTAEDFVYAWRRLVDPAKGGTTRASRLPDCQRKRDQRRKSPPETLASTRRIGEFTLRVRSQSPRRPFLKVAGIFPILAAVPRHAIQETDHRGLKRQMPSCGPFLLHEWKPYDRIVLRKNTRYL